MKVVIATAVIALSALSSTTVFAAGEKDLATKSACMACHAVDKKLVGPA